MLYTLTGLKNEAYNGMKVTLEEEDDVREGASPSDFRTVKNIGSLQCSRYNRA